MLKGYKSIHEGTISPLFYYLLFMLKEKVKELLEQGLEEDPSLFLIDFTKFIYKTDIFIRFFPVHKVLANLVKYNYRYTEKRKHFQIQTCDCDA